jgi:hypothetical protein
LINSLKKDFKTYFKTILINIIEDLELLSCNKEMQLYLTKIEQEVMILIIAVENYC